MFKTYALFFPLLLLSACQSYERDQLAGTWSVGASGDLPAAQLVLRPDNTFHVDILAKEGIEAEGRYLLQGREITFVNEKGTDAQASDAAPGVYEFTVGADTLSFDRITDPLQRRARFLARAWTRE